MRYQTAFLITAMILGSCNDAHSDSEIEAAMNKYNSYILSMNADSISNMFTPDGKLGEMAQGRDSIKRFLSSFVNSKVLSQRSQTTSIELKKDSATQKGMYFQTAVLNGKDTFHVKGNYTVNWKWLSREGWKIKKIVTSPIQ